MVNIKNENFNKLSQLDRIEYKQKYDECSFSINIIDCAWYMLIIFSIFMVGGYNDIARSIMVCAIYVAVIQIVLIMFCPMITKIKRNKLAEEYFECIVKKRGKK